MKKKLLTLSLVISGLSLLSQTPRLSLFEEFTGENCGPCAATNPGLNALLGSSTNTPLVVAIKWQVPIPSAPTTTWSLYKTNRAEIDWRYGASGYDYKSQWTPTTPITNGINSAPTGLFDGQHQWVFGAASDHPADIKDSVIAAAQSYTSAFSITMTRAWDKTCSAVNLTVSIQATAPFIATGPLVFRTVMVEKAIHFASAPGSNGEKDFQDVVIKSFPTIQSGVSMAGTWTIGQTQTFTLNCPIPSYTRNKSEVAFVGFIQDDGNKKVAQAVRAGKVALPPNALAGISANVDLTCTGLITPTVVIRNDGTLNPITNLTLTPYIDGVSYNTTTWTGNLAVGASATIILNSITSPSLSGGHTFTCDIDMSSPNYNLTQNAIITNYMIATNYQSTQVVEGFSSAVYPSPGFGIINRDGGPSWSKTIYAGAYNISPLGASKYDFFNNTVNGDQDEFYLPPMDLSAASAPSLFFDIAYAQRTAASDDALDVVISDNCGTTWTNVYNSHGAAMATTGPTPFAYVPDPSNPANWKTEFVDLGAFKKPNLLIKFVTTSNNGNNLYLDNINLLVASTTGISSHGMSSFNAILYPNPTNGISTLKVNTLNAGDARLSVMNMLGQVVYSKQLILNEGSNSIQIDTKEFANGIYNVMLDSKSSSIVKKLTVTK